MGGFYTRWIDMPDGTEQFDLGYDSGPDEDGYYECEDDDNDDEDDDDDES